MVSTLLAILPNGEEIPHSGILSVYHGTSLFNPEVAFSSGIPQKGMDRRLLEHARGNNQSAFRGSTTQVCAAPGQGAAYWADVGGWVYQINAVETWNLERVLEGRVPVPGGFAGVPHVGENEHAIPSAMPSGKLARAGAVVLGRTVGTDVRLLVKNWIRNPGL